MALSALGVKDARGGLYKQAEDLRPLFVARNQIAHEMDMTSAALRQKNGRSRHERALTAYIDMCHVGLNYCQAVLNHVEPHLNLALLLWVPE